MGDEQDEVDYGNSNGERDASPDKVFGYAQLLANPDLLNTIDTNSDEGWRQYSDSIVHFIGDFATKSKFPAVGGGARSSQRTAARHSRGDDRLIAAQQQPSVLTGKQTSAPNFQPSTNSRACLTSVVLTTFWPWRKIPFSTLLSPSIKSCGTFE